LQQIRTRNNWNISPAVALKSDWTMFITREYSLALIIYFCLFLYKVMINFKFIASLWSILVDKEYCH
jgi:hypothetical protein